MANILNKFLLMYCARVTKIAFNRMRDSDWKKILMRFSLSIRLEKREQERERERVGVCECEWLMFIQMC